MSILQAIVLGITQGLTEFLPISSSGHLILVPWLFGWDNFQDDPSLAKAFDVALHIGTLVAVVAYFRKDLVVYVRDGAKLVFKRKEKPTLAGRLAWLLVLSTVPAVLVGGLFSDQIDRYLGRVWIIAVSLIGFGLLMGWADSLGGKRSINDYGTKDAVKVGAAQVLALNPGTSRSGITITASRWLGFNRDSAARISFLMSIPVILAAIVYKMTGLVLDGIPSDLIIPMLVGIIAAGISGWVAVWGTLRYLRTHSFRIFVIYRVVLGVVVLAILATGWR